MRKKNRSVIFILTLSLLITAVSFPLLGASPSPAANRVKNDIVMRVGSAKAMLKGTVKYLDGNNLNVIPFTRDGAQLVPLRAIVETLGGKITVNSKNSYTVTVNGVTTTLNTGSASISVNSKSIAMKAAAVIENDRLYVPVTSVSDITGKYVFCENGLIVISDKKNPLTTPADNALIDALLSELSVIQSFASHDELKKYTEKLEEEYGEYYGWEVDEEGEIAFAAPTSAIMNDSAMKTQADEPQRAAASPEGDAGDYSQTNIQVAGVDEADIIRTDGKYIYALTWDELIIIEATPASDMKVLSRFTLSLGVPGEMYADGNKVTVICNDNGYSRGIRQGSGGIRTNAVVIDVSDRTKPKIIKTMGIDGYYLSSRKIEDNVYIVANSDIYGYIYGDMEPCFYEGDKTIQIPAPNIYIFPGKNYGQLTIMGFSLDNLNDGPNVTQYWGVGQTIYVSRKYMYLAEKNWGYDDIIEPMPWLRPMLVKGKQNTIIHKFALNDGAVDFIGSGAVPGYILNQFSMDEHNSHFRIATNANNANNVYILDSQLKVKSKIEDIAPGERIYSTRFIGNRGYMVTFKQTDPLFVIDMNPDDPKILGALKIPGYSDYLHPYDENTIIGFGKDTVEAKDTAFYQGMKIAMFDVTDVSNPKQKFVEIIGGRGTDSQLLYDHKALLFDKAKNLLAFPVTVYEGGDGVSSYGEFAFQGAYVYDISLDKGFVKRGEITHLTADEYKKAGRYWYYNGVGTSPEISRIIYIGDALYALSGRQLSAHNIKDVKQISSVNLEK